MADETKTQIPKPTRQRGPMGRMGGMRRGEKAKDFKGTMRQLLGYIGQHKIAVFTAVAFAVCSVIFNIVGPKVLGQVTTKLFEGLVAKVNGTGDVDFVWIAKTLGFLLCLYLASSACSLIQGWLMTGVTQKICYRMRKEIAAKIAVVPMSYFNGHSKGDVLSRITNDVDTITQTLNQSLSQIVTNVTMMVGVLCMMLSISPLMTLVVLCILPLSVLIVTQVVKRSQPFFRKQQEYLGHVNGHVEEMYGSHLIVTAFNGQEDSIEEFKKLNDNLYHAAWKSQFISSTMQPLMNFVSNLGYVGICVLGGFLTLNGSITVGDIQAFTQYVRQFTQPINQIANISNVLQMTAAAAERVFAFLEEEEETADPQPSLPAENIDGSVYFAHVHFGYVPEKAIINDFSAIIQPGTKVAIVGPTGCGKTEIARRLAKLMDAPFVKVEATKFTEVGYVGRDVDSMVRDLVEASIRITKQAMLEEKYSIADEIVEEKIIEAIIPGQKKAASSKNRGPFDFILGNSGYLSQKEEYEQEDISC